MLDILRVFTALLPLSCCLRIVSFEGPALLLPGDSAYLRCLYELGGERLYSVKWYKDAKEFYRYHPQLNPQFMAFQAPGINVDVSILFLKLLQDRTICTPLNLNLLNATNSILFLLL